MAVGSIFRSVGRFLFSKLNRELFIFLFFLILAGIFWLLMTLNENFEHEVMVPVRYTNVPRDAVMTSGDTDTIRIVVSDRGINLLPYIHNNVADPLDVDFMRYAGENGTGVVTATELQKLVGRHLSTSANVVTVKPENLVFYFNYGETKRVPVRWRGDVSPDKLHFISETRYEPDSVTIFASPRMLDSIKEMYTEPIYQRELHDSVEVNTRLQRIAGVKAVPNQVTVKFVTDILAQLSFDEVAVVPVNMPYGKRLRTFPAKVRVNFVAGIKRYKEISAADFSVVIDYNDIRRDTTITECDIHIQRTPEGVSNVTLSTDKVEFLIEDADM